MSGTNKLKLGDPGYGSACECGNRKHKASRVCQECHDESRPTALSTPGRTESIITFTRGSEVQTLHCFGHNAAGQIANGLNRLPGDGWDVRCLSTPASIFQDLKAAQMTQAGLTMRLNNLGKGRVA